MNGKNEETVAVADNENEIHGGTIKYHIICNWSMCVDVLHELQQII